MVEKIRDVAQPEEKGMELNQNSKQWKEEEEDMAMMKGDQKRSYERVEDEEDELEMKYLNQSNDQTKNIGGR
jgi:hypothetical protein